MGMMLMQGMQRQGSQGGGGAANAQGGQGQGNQGGGANLFAQPPPGTIQVTHEEKQAIERLKNLGYREAHAVEAFFACDKNEMLAANYLINNFSVQPINPNISVVANDNPPNPNPNANPNPNNDNNANKPNDNNENKKDNDNNDANANANANANDNNNDNNNDDSGNNKPNEQPKQGGNE